MRSSMLALVLAGCASAPIAPVVPAASVSVSASSEPEPVVALDPLIDKRFVSGMKDIVASYAKWPRSNDSALWAPTACAAPQPPPGAFLSQAEGPHGQKLYSIRLGKEPGLPQVFVKEAFAPELMEHDPGYKYGEFNPHVRAPDGKTYRMGAPVGLFVVIQTDSVVGTDAGWIYGTANVDGTITSLGRVKTCMGCHEKASVGRVLTPGLMHSNDG